MKSLGAKVLAIPTPVWVVGTFDREGKPNVMTAAWGGVCCSRPPCVNISLRKATYSYGNIVERQAFTINIPREEDVEKVDFIGTASGRDVDKFAVTKLTSVRSVLVDAPYIAEFPLVLECKVIHSLEIGLHTQFIGEIIDVKAEDAAVTDRNVPDIEVINPFVYSPGNRTYHAIGKSLSLAYTSRGKYAGIE
ncbi:MAG: flavin reductase family protein [Candidatus Bathyarchaeota archaeon]|nr:flavin reductase family protein [Candidatus Bathyarchaeota archaeon]|tara:strand:+ start:6586 stop:7161 length:576 start_codon:yes stop_codon:yes gene_type:complete